MKKTILLLCCLATAFSSCKKETIEGPQGPQGPAGANGTANPGTITGKVRQFDESGNEYKTGLNTTTVSVDGSTLSTITDATGSYTFNNVPAGVYALSFVKNGAGLVKITQITLPGNGTVYGSPKIADNASFVFTSALAKDTIIFGSKTVFVKMIYPMLANRQNVATVLSKSPEIDLADPSSYEVVLINALETGSTERAIAFNLNADLFSTFEIGSQVYIKTYPIALTNYSYFDAARNETIYTSYGAPFPTVSIVTKM